MAENGRIHDAPPTSIRLPKDAAVRLREIAKKEERSVAAQIRYALERHIREYDRQEAR